MLWHDGWGWGAWLAMVAANLVFWGLVFVAIAALMRGGSSDRASTDPQHVLGVRFATGEIDEEEYRRRLDALRAARGASRTPSRPRDG